MQNLSNESFIGYTRVSNSDQSLKLQRDALHQAGCLNIFEDFAKYNATMQRHGLIRLRKTLQPGDTLVVWRLDRIGYSMTGLLQFINELGYRDIAFKSLCERIELSSEENCKFITVFNAIRSHVNQNSESDGWRKLATKRAEGRMGQRHKTLDSQITKEIQSFLSQPSIPVADIAKRYSISRATIYSTLIKGLTGIAETQSTVQTI